jgi:hypothetical protein
MPSMPQTLQNLNEQISRDPKHCRFSLVLVKFASSVRAISTRAYQQLCEILLFPSPRRHQDLTRLEKTMVMTALDETRSRDPSRIS